jgi:hypothetical protein
VPMKSGDFVVPIALAGFVAAPALPAADDGVDED